MQILKKILPMLMPTPRLKPFHAGEVYYLWEAVASGNEFITVLETYQMNTDDKKLHLILQGLIAGIQIVRVNPIAKILKTEGFSVPPQPATKVFQGQPGSGQEVKLSDEEILNNLVAWSQTLLYQDARAIGACSNEELRKVFINLTFDDMLAYSKIIDFAQERQAMNTPPPATAKERLKHWGSVCFMGRIKCKDFKRCKC